MRLPPIDGSSLAVKLDAHQLEPVTVYFRLRTSLSPSSLCTGETATRAYTCIGFLAAPYLLWAGTVRRVLLMAGTNKTEATNMAPLLCQAVSLTGTLIGHLSRSNNANDDVNDRAIKIPRVITMKYISLFLLTKQHIFTVSSVATRLD